MDLSKLVSVKNADRDRIFLPNTIQLEISGLGRIFLHADSKESYDLWTSKFNIILNAVQGIPAPKPISNYL